MTQKKKKKRQTGNLLTTTVCGGSTLAILEDSSLRRIGILLSAAMISLTFSFILFFQLLSHSSLFLFALYVTRVNCK